MSAIPFIVCGVEESLKEMKEVARMKLGIPPNAAIVLEQIRDGKPIDLEDGEAHHFLAARHAHSTTQMMISMLSILLPTPHRSRT